MADTDKSEAPAEKPTGLAAVIDLLKKPGVKQADIDMLKGSK